MEVHCNFRLAEHKPSTVRSSDTVICCSLCQPAACFFVHTCTHACCSDMFTLKNSRFFRRKAGINCCCGEGHLKFVGISLEGRQHNSLECKAQPGYQIPSDSDFAIFAVNCSFDSKIAKCFYIASLSPQYLSWKCKETANVTAKKRVFFWGGVVLNIGVIQVQEKRNLTLVHAWVVCPTPGSPSEAKINPWWLSNTTWTT